MISVLRLPVADLKQVVARAIERGWVKPAVPPPFGFSKKSGTPRFYRNKTLTHTEYTRLRREALYTAGKTARGTVPKHRNAKAFQP